MSEEHSKPNREHEPLTVAHGKSIHELCQKISRQVAQLTPLLELLNSHNSENEDPIGLILKHFEILLTLAQRQSKALADLDMKVSALIANSNIEMP